MQSTEILLWLIEPAISLGVGQSLGEAGASSLPSGAPPSVPTSPNSIPPASVHTATEATHVANSVTWAEFLSPLSLSVALNMAYFTVSSFVNPIASNQRKLLSQLENSINAAQKQDSFDDEMGRISDLRNKLAGIEYDESQKGKWFRFFALLFLFAGLFMIMYGMFYMATEIPQCFMLINLLFFSPFIFMSLYTVVLISRRYGKLDKERHSLSKDVQAKLGAERPEASAA